jgi:hypothetical protein
MAPQMKHFQDNPFFIVDSPLSRSIEENIERRRKRRQARRRTRPSRNRDIIVAPRQESSKKSVSFSPIIRFRNVKHIDDFTDEEFEETWNSQTDLDIILEECAETVYMMVNGEVLLEEDGFCKRGLEYKTPKGSKFRKGNKVCAMQKVMKEQSLQKNMGMVNAEYLAELYIDATENSKRLALMMGLRDEEESRPLLQSKSSLYLLREKRQLRSSSPTSSPTSVVDAFRASSTREST